MSVKVAPPQRTLSRPSSAAEGQRATTLGSPGRVSEQGKTKAATEAQTTLKATAASETTGEELAKQLDQLADAIDPQKSPEAAKAAADRGGPEALSPLREAAAALREAVKRKPTVRGTPEATQRIDQIDGIIVDICRRGRDAAEATSKDRGDPAILKAFKLDKLYAARSGGAKKEESPSPAEGASGETT